jgi:hypothetical protein
VSTCPPPDEAIHKFFPPAQEEEDEVGDFPFQDPDNALFYDSEKEEETEFSNEVDLPCHAVEDKGETHEDETMMHVEDTQVLEAPAQKETNIVSYPPIHDFDNFLLYDLGKGEEMGEPSNILNPPCYDTDTDIVDIDEFIHVGRRKWDIVGFDMDPIYDTENHSQLFPSQLSRQITFDFWQQGNDIFTDAPQTPKVDLVPYSPDDFWSYLEGFDEHSSEHLDLFYEDDHQPPLFFGFDNNVCPKKDSYDIFL